MCWGFFRRLGKWNRLEVVEPFWNSRSTPIWGTYKKTSLACPTFCTKNSYSHLLWGIFTKISPPRPENQKKRGIEILFLLLCPMFEKCYVFSSQVEVISLSKLYFVFILNQHILLTILLCKHQKPLVVLQHTLQSAPFIIQPTFNHACIFPNV